MHQHVRDEVEAGSAIYTDAPPSAVLAVIQTYRERGLQAPFTQGVLIRAGVTDQLAARTAQALRLLDFIDDDGNPSRSSGR